MSRTPVYEQIIEQIEKRIGAGILREGEQLPSVRSLSLELSVNPNTIQKAYAELDAKGIIASVPGKGCYVLPGAGEILKCIAKKRLSEITSITAELLLAGVPIEEIIDAVNRAEKPKKEAHK